MDWGLILHGLLQAIRILWFLWGKLRRRELRIRDESLTVLRQERKVTGF